MRSRRRSRLSAQGALSRFLWRTDPRFVPTFRLAEHSDFASVPPCGAVEKWDNSELHSSLTWVPLSEQRAPALLFIPMTAKRFFRQREWAVYSGPCVPGGPASSPSLASGATASTGEVTTNLPSTSQPHELFLGEEEISDVSLSTFYVFDKENAAQPKARGESSGADGRATANKC